VDKTSIENCTANDYTFIICAYGCLFGACA